MMVKVEQRGNLFGGQIEFYNAKICEANDELSRIEQQMQNLLEASYLIKTKKKRLEAELRIFQRLKREVELREEIASKAQENPLALALNHCSLSVFAIPASLTDASMLPADLENKSFSTVSFVLPPVISNWRNIYQDRENERFTMAVYAQPQGETTMIMVREPIESLGQTNVDRLSSFSVHLGSGAMTIKRALYSRKVEENTSFYIEQGFTDLLRRNTCEVTLGVELEERVADFMGQSDYDLALSLLGELSASIAAVY